MKKSFSVLTIISFVISIIGFLLYTILLSGINVYLPWIVLSIASIFLPIASKYFRKKSGSRGNGLEIATLVIGSWDFYFVFFAATKIDLYIVFAMIAGICFLYAKLFNNIHPDESKSPTTYSDSAPQSSFIASPICFCRKCGEKLTDNSRFCHKCGTAVEITDTSSVAPKEPATVWVCEKCKTKNLSTRNDCWSCGASK